MELNELFNSKAISLHYTNAVDNAVPFLGVGFFPPKRSGSIDLKWYKGHNGLPVALMPSTLDAKARFRDRVGIEVRETEMPFFREAMIIKEKDQQDIDRVKSADDPFAQEILDNIFNDAKNLVDGANVVPERMRMQLLAPLGGKLGIEIKANGVDYTYNYDPDGTWAAEHYAAIETEADKWTASETCDPIGDILAARKAQYKATGEYPAIMLMTDNTFSLIYKSAKVRSGFLAMNATAVIEYTEEDVKAYVEKRTKMRIVTYDKMFKDETGTARSFYPDNIVMMLPNGAVGDTHYATTPEERSGSKSKADVSIVETGVAIETYTTEHPIQTITVVSEIVLPSFAGMDRCYALEVA